MKNFHDKNIGKFKKGILVGFILTILLVALVISFFDIVKLKHLMLDLKWINLLYAILSMFVAYLCATFAYQAMLFQTGCQVPLVDVFKITMISVSTNTLVTTGGVSGVGLRAILLRSQGVSYSTTIALSLLYFFMGNVYLSIFFVAGVVNHFNGNYLPGMASIVIPLVVFTMILVMVCVISVACNKRLRKKFIKAIVWLLNSILNMVTVRNISDTFVEKINDELEKVIVMVKNTPRSFLKCFLFAGLDWILFITCFQFCFLLVGADISIWELLMGVSLGTLTSMITMIPGGLGVMEGSMTYYYYQLGIPPEQTVAAILFLRLVFFIIPFGISMGMFWKTLKTILG